ncbi:hypothetical protein PV326_013201 [Microctonus aethiopoides]|nr:hypothetical protein PV326_013201 [Microctonus aethiopoides]
MVGVAPEDMVWNYDTTYALGLYKTMGRTLGIWPLDNKSFVTKMRLTFIIFLQVWTCIDISKKLLIKSDCGTIIETMDVISWIVCGLLTAIKVIFLTIYKDKMYPIIYSAVEDWSTIVDKQSRFIMLQYAYVGRIVAIIQMSGAYIACFIQLFTRLPFIISFWNDGLNSTVAVQGVPPWPSCWVSADMTFYHYIFHFIVQSFILLVIGTVYNGCDTFFFGIAMHICGQFVVFQKNFRHLHAMDNSILNVNQLKYFVKRHKYLLELADNFEETYNLVILIHVGAATVLICASGIVVLISLQSLDLVTIGGMMMRISLTYVILFMYSYAGEKLCNEVANIQMAVYNISWYEMPIATRKDMIFMIMRCNSPFNLTAGKLCDMNLSNFANIVKSMASYFSILRLMLIEK